MLVKHIRARKRREELKLTQRQVAKLCRVTQQAYEKFERGETKRPRYIYELAKALKVSPDWLSTGEQPEPGNTSPAPAFDKARKIPVFSFGGALKSNRLRHTFDDGEVIDRVAPLPNLEETQGAVALFLQDEEFAPSYPQGTIIYLDRHKSPAPKQPCLCFHAKEAAILIYLGVVGVVHNFRCVDSGKIMRINARDIKALYRIAGVTYS